MLCLKHQILHRVRGGGRGRVFISKDFMDLGSRVAVNQALSRLVRTGELRRLGRGLFDYPRVSPTLGTLSPDADEVAQAIARKRGGRVRRSGASAANDLGLTTQVPGRRVYLTDSSAAKARVGNQTLRFKRVAPKHLPARDNVVTSVIIAIEFIGRDGMTEEVVERLRMKLAESDRKRLLKESRYAASWVADVIKKVVRH